MNILKEYTLDYMKRNKKSSLAAMVAILIATTLLSALCGVLNTLYTDNVRLTIESEGNWHAELFDDTAGDKLKYVIGHPNVKEVMIKGTWEAAAIEDPRRPYLIYRPLTSSYWADMPEHSMILKGRVPREPHELAVSKQYFEHHPEVKVGDTLELPTGRRFFRGEVLDPRDSYREGEQFVEDESRTYTIVGILDSATSSVTPAYLAYGWMDEKAVEADDRLTVYLRFENPRTAYGDIETIARSVGFRPDEFGDYPVRVHSSLLSKYFIFPETVGGISWEALGVPLMYGTIALLVAALFILIIYNAFALSADMRLYQLGILQSIGASPGQIGRSVIFEAVLLAAFAIPVGLILGYGLDWFLFHTINQMWGIRNGMDVVFTFGIPAALPAVLLALLTVWISALLPVRKIRKISPIQAIRQGSESRIKRPKRHRRSAPFLNIETELAAVSFSSRKRSYRTALISLTISFLLLNVFLSMMTITDIQNRVIYAAAPSEQRHMGITIVDGRTVDPEFQDELRRLPGIKTAIFSSSVPAAMWVTEEQESAELKEAGGLAWAAGTKKYYVYGEGGRYRVRTDIIALDDASFVDYCRRIGADPQLFYNAKKPYVIAVNQIKDCTVPGRRQESFIPFLKLQTGEHILCSEKVYEEDVSEYIFETEIGFVAEQMPTIGYEQGNYRLNQIMPLSVYEGIISDMQETRQTRARYTDVFIQGADHSEQGILNLSDRVESLVGKWYG